MRRVIALIILLFCFSNKSSAVISQHFDFNDQQVECEFAQLSTLENFVVTNTLNHNDAMILELSKECYLVSSFPDEDEDGFKNVIPPRLWGFCLGPVGILVVMLSKHNQKDMKDSVVGCLIGGALSYIISTLLGYQVF